MAAVVVTALLTYYNFIRDVFAINPSKGPSVKVPFQSVCPFRISPFRSWFQDIVMNSLDQSDRVIALLEERIAVLHKENFEAKVKCGDLDAFEGKRVEKITVCKQAICAANEFYESPGVCPVQDFPKNPSEFSLEWLSGALNEQVVAFDTKICGEGQVGLTIIIKDIKYKGVSDKPTSLAIKIHGLGEAQRGFANMARCYQREINFYLNMAQGLPEIDIPKVEP